MKKKSKLQQVLDLIKEPTSNPFVSLLAVKILAEKKKKRKR